MAKGISSLGFRSSVDAHDEGAEDVLHLSWQSRSPFMDEDVRAYSRLHGSAIPVHMFAGCLPHLCEDCQDRLAENLDFSALALE